MKLFYQCNVFQPFAGLLKEEKFIENQKNTFERHRGKYVALSAQKPNLPNLKRQRRFSFNAKMMEQSNQIYEKFSNLLIKKRFKDTKGTLRGR